MSDDESVEKTALHVMVHKLRPGVGVQIVADGRRVTVELPSKNDVELLIEALREAAETAWGKASKWG